MKRNKIIYWVSTGLFGAMMLFSGYSYFTNPQMTDAFKHLGFPDYFRIELGSAKLLGALVLLIPQIPVKIKEWAYAGFGIVMISAAIAHNSSGDPTSAAVTPLIMLVFLVVSNIYFSKVKQTTA
jgi:hypothetical protein